MGGRCPFDGFAQLFVLVDTFQSPRRKLLQTTRRRAAVLVRAPGLLFLPAGKRAALRLFVSAHSLSSAAARCPSCCAHLALARSITCAQRAEPAQSMLPSSALSLLVFLPAARPHPPPLPPPPPPAAGAARW